MKKEYQKLIDQTEEAKRDRATRNGVAYETGVGLGGGYTDAELALEGDPSVAGSKRKQSATAKFCKACKGTDHTCITSKKCDKHNEWMEQRGKALPNMQGASRQEILNRDALQQDDFHSLPFTNGIKDNEMLGVQDASSAQLGFI